MIPGIAVLTVALKWGDSKCPPVQASAGSSLQIMNQQQATLPDIKESNGRSMVCAIKMYQYCSRGQLWLDILDTEVHLTMFASSGPAQYQCLQSHISAQGKTTTIKRQLQHSKSLLNMSLEYCKDIYCIGYMEGSCWFLWFH